MPSVKKVINLTIFNIFFLFLFANSIFADDFKTSLTSTYKIDENASATVNFEYSLENLKSEILAKEFHVNFTHLKPQNLKVTQDGQDLAFTTSEEQNSIYLKVLFPDDLYGIGKKRIFDITFTENNISKKTGNVVEVSIPKINSDDLDRYESILDVPNSIGLTAYLTPQATDNEVENDRTSYHFRGKSALENGISAAFGEFQVFDYIINYNLHNQTTKSSIQEVAFPPDTQYQKVYITNIEPSPISSKVDEDGNWIYAFKLSALEKKSIKLEGSVQLFSNPRSLTLPTPQSIIKNLGETSLWQTNSDPIKKLAEELKTPEKIYQYVTKNLKYNFERVNPQSQRQGAIKALQNSTNSLCTDFTDLFIAISRSAGIPAREIQGYAYTTNDKLQPLSLVSDVLHAWPEYWDNERKAWISVDPTWESTTGVDYFSKFDLNHFAFAIHGANDQLPLPAGSYKFSSEPKKDVYVSYGKVPQSKTEVIKLTSNLLHKYNPFYRTIKIEVENTNNSAIYNANLKISSENKNFNENFFVGSLIPHEKYVKQIKINYGLLGRNAPDKIQLSFNDQQFDITTERDVVLISQIALLLIFIFVIVIAFFVSHKRARRG